MKQFVKNEAPNAFLQTRAQVSTASCLTRVGSSKTSQTGASLAQKQKGWKGVPGWSNGPGESPGIVLFLFCPGKGRCTLL